jgi:hypothetical protein
MEQKRKMQLTGIKWPRFSRTPTLRPLAQYLGYPRVHAQPGRDDKFRLGLQVVKSYPPTVNETGKRAGVDCSQV